MDGSATFTIVASTTIISWPRQTTKRAIQRRCEEVRERVIVTRSWTISLAMIVMQRAIIWTAMSIPGEHGSMVLLTRLSRAVHRAAKEETLGMTFKQYATLASLRVPGSLPQQELCISMHLDPNNCV